MPMIRADPDPENPIREKRNREGECHAEQVGPSRPGGDHPGKEERA